MHWGRKWHPTPVFLPGESQGRGSLVGCRLWGRTESDTTERLHFHFSLSCTGEGNGNLVLQCSCLENPRDRGAWWAVVSGVAQSWTRLKQLSSSSSPILHRAGKQCFPGGTNGKESSCQCKRRRRHKFSLWVRKIPRGGNGDTPVFLPGESHGQRSLTGYSP